INVPYRPHPGERPHPAPRPTAEGNGLSQRVLSRPEPFGKPGIDDGHQGRALLVQRGESPALQDRDLHRREEIEPPPGAPTRQDVVSITPPPAPWFHPEHHPPPAEGQRATARPRADAGPL